MGNKKKEPDDEINKWMVQAKRDLKTARNSYKSKDYYASAFFAQQAVEKGLKAIYIKKYKKLIRIHDLVELAKKIGAEEDILNACSMINPVYTGSRYPDVIDTFNKSNTDEILRLAKKVMKWIEENL